MSLDIFGWRRVKSVRRVLRGLALALEQTQQLVEEIQLTFLHQFGHPLVVKKNFWLRLTKQFSGTLKVSISADAEGFGPLRCNSTSFPALSSGPSQLIPIREWLWLIKKMFHFRVKANWDFRKKQKKSKQLCLAKLCIQNLLDKRVLSLSLCQSWGKKSAYSSRPGTVVHAWPSKGIYPL